MLCVKMEESLILIPMMALVYTSNAYLHEPLRTSILVWKLLVYNMAVIGIKVKDSSVSCDAWRIASEASMYNECNSRDM